MEYIYPQKYQYEMANDAFRIFAKTLRSLTIENMTSQIAVIWKKVKIIITNGGNHTFLRAQQKSFIRT
jgi:protein involved in temperature-dependent protein secretion